MEDRFELREISGKGMGVFATKSFKVGDIVMIGVIKEVLKGNNSHSSQIGENEYVLHAGLISKVNHSCDPNCGIRVNETGAHDFVAMVEIGVNEETTFDYAMRNYTIDFSRSNVFVALRNVALGLQAGKIYQTKRKRNMRVSWLLTCLSWMPKIHATKFMCRIYRLLSLVFSPRIGSIEVRKIWAVYCVLPPNSQAEFKLDL